MQKRSSSNQDISRKRPYFDEEAYNWGFEGNKPKGEFEEDTYTLILQAICLKEAATKLQKLQQKIYRKRKKVNSKELPKCEKDYLATLIDAQEAANRIAGVLPGSQLQPRACISECTACLKKNTEIWKLTDQSHTMTRYTMEIANSKKKLQESRKNLDAVLQTYVPKSELQEWKQKFDEEKRAKDVSLRRLDLMYKTTVPQSALQEWKQKFNEEKSAKEDALRRKAVDVEKHNRKVEDDLSKANKALETERTHREKVEEEKEKYKRDKDAVVNTLALTKKELEIAKKESHILRSPTRVLSEEWKTKIQTAETELKKEREQRIDKERELIRIHGENEELLIEKKELQQQVDNVKSDLEDALSKLSNVSGANSPGVKLTDISPGTAQLSDPNRPTKIAERYSELYDNEWTDAFGILEDENKSEVETIKVLLDILQNAYAFCDEVSQKQTHTLKATLLCPVQHMQSLQLDERTSFTEVDTQMISEMRKQTADVSVEDVIRHFMKKDILPLPRSDNHKAYIEAYKRQCIELCWLMCVQSPPVYIDVRFRGNFDTDKFKPYTRSGNKVAFFVWPPLYLEQDGAILCKGVAQGKN